MAKRVKSDNISLEQIESLEQADKVLREIGDLQHDINAYQEGLREDVDELKNAAAQVIKPMQDKIKQKTASLEAFATANRKGYFGKAQSRILNFGLIGWRRSTKISIAKNTLEKIKEVFSPAKAKSLVRTKEEVDKQALAKLTDEQLASVGAKRKGKEAFFAEPALAEAVDYEEAK
jgi:phage host-nuclease inhibitor protein Gam